MRTLRGRLILSHILPLLLVVPIVGVALVYIVETQVVLTSIQEELADAGAMTADLASGEPLLWSDSVEAQHFVTLYNVYLESHVMLFDAQGILLATSDPNYRSYVGRRVGLPNLTTALQGEQYVGFAYVQEIKADVVQVLVPVVGPDQQIMGVVRLSQHMTDVQQQLVRVRYLIAGVLAVALVLAIIIGLVLALSLGRSLQRVTDAIYGVASGREWRTLPEEGPEEIRTLLLAFNTLIERLRVFEESRRRLLANLVHELGRPLGALHSATQALLGGAGEDPELRQELLEGMDTQVQRLRPLLDSLTDLYDQVLGALELSLQPITLGQWLRQTVTPWREVAHDKGLHWRIDIPDTLPTLEIDPDRMAQALGNLLSNAIKYTPEGTVSVEAYAQDESVSIVVGDTGIGIAPSEQERIFEPFYRSSRDKRFPQGMGLGLSIARDLVVAHGGRLEVESTLEEDSRFIIRLPWAAAPGVVGDKA